MWPGSLQYIATKFAELLSGTGTIPVTVSGGGGTGGTSDQGDPNAGGSVAWPVKLQVGNSSTSAANPVHVAPGTSALWDVSDRVGRAVGAVTNAVLSGAGILTGWTPMQPTALPVAGIVVKAAPGLFGAGSANNGTPVACFLQVHNLAAASGLSTATIVATSTTTATSGLGVPTVPNGGIVCDVGIVLAWSSTQYTYTAPASNTGSVIAAYK